MVQVVLITIVGAPRKTKIDDTNDVTWQQEDW
jgi:hypothetical protein